jgi:hypothetical protein
MVARSAVRDSAEAVEVLELLDERHQRTGRLADQPGSWAGHRKLRVRCIPTNTSLPSTAATRVVISSPPTARTSASAPRGCTPRS